MKFVTAKLLSIALIITTLFVVTACVGKVKDTTPVKTIANTEKENSVTSYIGIISAKAISNSKIEVFFPPIDGDTDKISYIISYDRQSNPVYVDATTMKPDYRGILKYTITGLNSDTSYVFNVQAKNNSNGKVSANSLKFSATTFANITANFYGVSEVRNLSGSQGLNGIEVLWPEAQILGSDISRNTLDPIEYKITVIDAAFLNPGNINDATFSEPQRKVISVAGSKRSMVVNGLKPATKYYVQVRCIHYGFSLNSSNSAYKVEENSNYQEISTYSDDLANLNFKNNSFYLTWPPGIGGLSTLLGNWEAPIGNFDHYRIYYAITGTVNLNTFLNSQEVDALCLDEEVSDSRVSCQETNFASTNAYIAGLIPNTSYDVILAVCITGDCAKSKRVISQLKTKITTPPVVSFQGISTIETSTDINELNTLTLKYSPIDFTTGNIAGLLVDYYGNSESNASPKTINDPSIVNNTGLTVDSFDYRATEIADTQIIVRGINTAIVDKQCFLVYPFSYNNDGSKNLYLNLTSPVCIIPNLKAPTATEFPGLTISNTDTPCQKSAHRIDINWTAPTKGIFSKYEIFYTNSLLPFNFTQALNYLSGNGYQRVQVDKSITTYSITNLETGPTVNYQVGILTYYNSANGPLRSDFNASIINCNDM